MKDISTLNRIIEAYINGTYAEITNDSDVSAAEKGKRSVAESASLRLIHIFEEYKAGKASLEDYYCAIRNYLLFANTSLGIPLNQRETMNRFGLFFTSEGRVSAAFKIPNYVSHKEFVKTAFLSGYEAKAKKSDYYLSTSPYIYRITGFQSFKSLAQKLAVNGALATPPGYTTLVSLPTGSGKSLITQSLAYQYSGLTVVVVPTVSLAIDQVRVARDIIKTKNAGQEIYCYYSGSQDKGEIFKGLKGQTIRLLFISPEALIENEFFQNILLEACQNNYLRNVVIDEAHIVIDWGNFFRVDYQCLEPWRRRLLESNSQLRTILLSATFTEDVVDNLKSLFSEEGKWIEIRCDALRREPRFICVKSDSYHKKIERAEELIDLLPRPMIVYVSSPYEAELLKKSLAEKGYKNVNTFTGETPSDERVRLINDWTDDRFDLMIATSAFGVGVDKGDIRTVMHLYVPETPNSYYQELGRGGRDGFPCLSVMCIDPSRDMTSSKIEKILTVPKLSGRWLSMLNDPGQQRSKGIFYLNTNVKPFYNVNTFDDEEEGTKADVRWNVNVLLLLRRYGIITIESLQKLSSSNNYIFGVRINDPRVLKSKEDPELVESIATARDKEYTRVTSAFDLIKNSIRHSEDLCWSEMFYSTYMMVSEYCGGCNCHEEIIDGDPSAFALKSPVEYPIHPVYPGINSLFGEKKEALTYFNEETLIPALDALKKYYGLNVIVVDDIAKWAEVDYLRRSASKDNLQIMGLKEFRRLLQQNDHYYLSGLIAAIYFSNDQDTYDLLNILKIHQGGPLYVMHLAYSNFYISQIGKTISEVIYGLIVNIQRLIGKGR